jgi:aminobenzoyl-glutamate utilization protein B
MRSTLAVALAAALAAAPLAAQSAKQQLAASIDSRFAAYTRVADQIWSFAEVGYQETKSSSLLQGELRLSPSTVVASR